MSQSTAVSLVVITLAAVLAPILTELVRRFRIPSVLFELLLGIVIGPSLLGWAELSPFVTGLSSLGLAFLFFVAGYEIDFGRLRGSPINRGIGGWAVSLVLGLTVGVILMISGFVISSLLVGLALTTTAIGTLLPMLHDRGLLETRFGDFLAAAGAVGEFGPILAVTILLGSVSPGAETALLLAFVLLALGVAYMASRPQPPKVVEVLQRHLSTSTQLPVRVIMLLITAMVAVATVLGLDMLLGAFAAGLIARIALDRDQAELLGPKLESIGFGFLIPVFFIVSGMKFDATALFSSGSTAVRVPIFLGLFLLVRGLPALGIYRKVLTATERMSLALLQSTALPLLVVITEIGLETKQMRPENATALVGAGMLSVLVFPLAGFALLGREERKVPAAEGMPADLAPEADPSPLPLADPDLDAF
jgi:Kef-type K+ transport system membrane component KefB